MQSLVHRADAEIIEREVEHGSYILPAVGTGVVDVVPPLSIVILHRAVAEVGILLEHLSAYRTHYFAHQSTSTS